MKCITKSKEENKINVSVIIPIYNEGKYIKNCILSMLSQDYEQSIMEWIFVDGGSTDNTLAIIKEFIELYPDLIRLIINPNKTVPYSMNIGIKASKGKYIIRLDAHCEYPKNYISRCVYYLESIDADNVGGFAITKSKGFIGKSIAMVLSSKFGVGNSKFRTQKSSGYVDTVPFGAFRREVFEKYGMYDERLTRNQDNEMNYRIIKNGGKVYLADDISFSYYCRDNLKSLIEMAINNGKWNVITMKICPGAMSIRHFIPFFFFLSLIILPLLSIFSHFFLWLLIVELIAYLSLDLVFSFKATLDIKFVPFLVILFPMFHLSYGWGSLLAIVCQMKS